MPPDSFNRSLETTAHDEADLLEGKFVDHRRELLRYCSVLTSVALAFLLRLSLHPLLGNKAAFITIFPAIVYSAWIAGLSGGLLATALSAVVAAWFIFSPADFTGAADPADQFSLLVFVFVGVAISILGQAQHLAQQRAEQNARAAARSAAVLEEREERYRAVIEALAEGVTVQDAKGLFQETNSSAERILGLTRDQMAGRTSADPRWKTVHEDGSLLSGDEHPPMVALRTGQPVRDMVMGIHKPDGTFSWLSANAELVLRPETGTPMGVVTSFFDITVQREAQLELRTRATREALLNRINESIRATADPEIIRETAAALVGEALKADRCYFSVYDPQKDAVRIARDWHHPGLPSVAGEYHLSEYKGYVDALYANGTAIVSDSVSREVPPDVRRVLGGFGIRAFLAVPLLDDGKFVAALAASVGNEPRSWTHEEVSLMEAVLTQTRAAVEAARASQRERRFVRDVLASVTDGKLLLCDAEADLPVPLTPLGELLPLSSSGGLRGLRQLTHQACELAGLSPERSHDLVTAASEAGMNAIVHAGTGTGLISASEDGVVQVRVEDQGSGISMENLPRATLARGFSTKATLGHGLKMMLETADRLYLLTSPSGTTVVLEQYRMGPSPSWL